MRLFKKIISTVLSLAMLFVSIIVFDLSTVDAATIDTALLSDMKRRADAILNYEWIPQNDIVVWNYNTYNGDTVFRKGSTVKGMPYTLFNGQCTLAKFKSVKDSNYTHNAYLGGYGDRTGPYYGSCCASFVCEVMGGSFMPNGNFLTWNVGGIEDCRNAYHYTSQTIDQIKPGDALSNTSGSHVIWISDVTDSTVTIYEQTYPVTNKTTLSKTGNVNSAGYLVYGGSIYNIVTRVNVITEDTHIRDTNYATNITAYPKRRIETNEIFDINHSPYAGAWIETDEQCTIVEVYTDGCCKVTYPLSSGEYVTRYSKIDLFFDVDEPSAQTIDSRYPVPIKAYTVTDTDRPAYDAPNGNQIGNVYRLDQFTVLEIYTNGWSKIDCPWDGCSSGRIVYIPTADIFDTSFKPTSKTVIAQTEVYWNPGGSYAGYIGAGDTVIVVDEVNGYSQVIYPVTAGGYKCAWAVLAAETSTEYKPGDINGDGEIDAADAGLISRYDAGFITLTADQLLIGDVNKDGEVDAADAGLISRYDAGFIVSFDR